ncbi:arabinose efflux permease [Renibacterium salmoninarum ATCC 33209]|uniref:Arabinose efflux permease n=1 Tax=Renibacterium salmoninarum (strain ATCC 33209 / DSM 20767 / JCM 11484 / NBRC 15589 / NCIMB 2235) TaxID=288705 RepID=A9WQ70_RENSM|nr:arabinose efflux permease [Renibacterium salmoninarum ATCC 33209]
MVLFIAGNLLSAVAPTFSLMLTGRILAALTHGAFFGIGAVVAANMVAPERKGAAISMMFAGLTMATVLGVPFGTLLGQNFGWRSTFAVISVLGLVAMAGIALLVPKQHVAGKPSRLRDEIKAFGKGQVWLSIAVTILGFGGMFGAFTYIAYTLTEVTGFASTLVPWLLILFGLGSFAGNLIGGKTADKARDKTLAVSLTVLTVILIVFSIFAANPVVTISALVLMAGFGFGTVPGLQMRIMHFAHETPTLASGSNIAAFNIGNALGAWLGGVGIGVGLGYTSPIWIGAILSGLGLLVILIAAKAASKKSAVLAEALPTAVAAS